MKKTSKHIMLNLDEALVLFAGDGRDKIETVIRRFYKPDAEDYWDIHHDVRLLVTMIKLLLVSGNFEVFAFISGIIRKLLLNHFRGKDQLPLSELMYIFTIGWQLRHCNTLDDIEQKSLDLNFIHQVRNHLKKTSFPLQLQMEFE
jgi:hypothetical protein